MRILKIAVFGDNDALHEKALKAACEAIEAVNGHGNVYRAWAEKVDSEQARHLAAGEVDR